MASNEFGRLAPCLVPLLPELQDQVDHRGDPCDQETLKEALTQAMVTSIGNTPGTLFMDDAHMLDAATLELIAYIDDRIRGLPILLTLAYRPEETPPGHAFRVFRDTLRRRRRLNELTPRRFTRVESIELLNQIGRHGIESPAQEAVLRISDGVPLFLSEICREMSDQQVERLATSRLESRGPDRQ